MPETSGRRFVVVSGLPGSGKSVLARRLASWLDLPVIDKDDILNHLFESRGIGDTAWRRTLSRESDLIFRQQAEASGGALLVSFWRLPGMSAESGTPVDWLSGLSNRMVNLHCVCPAEVAAARFIQRKRHPGHLDNARTSDQILASIRAIGHLPPLGIEPRVEVDTSVQFDDQDLAGRILQALEGPNHV